MTESQKQIKLILIQIPIKGDINKAMAIIWETVFNLPQKLAPWMVFLPDKLGLIRQPAMVNSLAKIRNTAQAGI